ncbi:MAG: YicC family protein, partial [Thermoleophilia bacterium]|nr:YicC family protein [Thermoleophilia bacterium]
MTQANETVRSMTGFAQVRRQLPEGELVVSLRSVNHRALDIRVYLGPDLESCENTLRKLVAGRLHRGHVELRVHFRRHPEAALPVLNKPLLEAYMRAFEQAREAYALPGEIDLNQALRYPGVLAPPLEEEPSEGFFEQLEEAVNEALDVLNAFREREGRELVEEIRVHLASIEEQVARMEQLRAEVTPKFRQRLQTRLEELLGSTGIEPHRLIQEAAILADRSDIQEEL